MEDWHVKREVTVGHIVTTAMLMVGIISAWATMSERLTIQETVMNAHLERDNESMARQERIDKATLTEIKELRKDFHAFIINRLKSE